MNQKRFVEFYLSAMMKAATNAIESGHKQEKGRYVPALGKKLTADRVAGKGVYAGARQRAERIAYQAAERFVKKIQQKLKEG